MPDGIFLPGAKESSVFDVIPVEEVFASRFV